MPDTDASASIAWKLDDTELLNHCRNERRNSIGFGDGDGGELIGTTATHIVGFKA